jgi:crossover junction endodeoxyribonuclease RusA
MKRRTIPQKRMTVNAISFVAGWPPSVNHYWMRNRNGGMRIGDEGQAYRKVVEDALRGRGCIQGRLAINIHAYPPDRRERDLDNILKALLDAIAHAGAIESDKYIDEIRIFRGCVIKGGEVRVDIQRII